MTTWVAMSGGVDSTTAAARVLGRPDLRAVTMRVLTPGEDPAYDASLEHAADEAARLGIPHELVDLSAQFEARVLRRAAGEIAAGRTPNPCTYCNEEIKFGVLFEWAEERAGERFVTGHYVRTGTYEDRPALLRAVDPRRDQSYFLYRLREDLLGRLEFPLGGELKADVVREAAENGLAAADRTESQDLCFARSVGLVGRVLRLEPDCCSPGEIVDENGRVLADHRGLAHYTIGQRKGLGNLPGAYKVVRLDAGTNRLIVSQESRMAEEIVAVRPVWRATVGRDVVCRAQTRYRAAPVPAVAICDGERLRVRLEVPLADVAPGQAVVCYAGDVCLGGGEIDESR